MVTIEFILNKEQTFIDCSKDDYIEDICKKFTREKNIINEEIIYLYKGRKLNLKKTFNYQIQKEDIKKNKMTILCIKKNKINNNLN